MVNFGLKNETKVNEIEISGSLAIKTKNSLGVHLFEQKNPERGIISGKLNKPKYNETELVKSVDTTIIELLPVAPPELEDTVLRRIYNPVTQSVIDLTEEITVLETEINNLNSKIGELELVTESLRIEVDNQSLNAAVSENQASQYNLKIQSSVVDLSNAIQKATSEAINRVSLTARIQALEEQNKIYKEQVEGKTAKVQEGHTPVGDITFKIVTRDRPEDKDLRVEVTAKLAVQWINGPEIEFYNTGDTAATVEFKEDSLNLLKSVPPLTLQPKETKVVTLEVDTGKAATKDPKGSGGIFGGIIAGKDKDYDGNLTIVTPKGNKTLTFRLYKKKK